MSKGSNPRPFSVSNEEYANRWDAIFGKDKEPEYEQDDGPLTQEQLEQVRESVARNT